MLWQKQMSGKNNAYYEHGRLMERLDELLRKYNK